MLVRGAVRLSVQEFTTGRTYYLITMEELIRLYCSSPRSFTSFKSMSEPQNRQRLRPWLEDQINRRRFPGVEWIDEKEKIFKLPWKHGGKQDWQESDSLIFKEWAIHTGRFREGIDTPDWPSWKTRLRCALNKLPDIKEEKTMGNLDGVSPFRVYKFLPKKGNQSVTSQLDNDEIEHSLMATEMNTDYRNESNLTRQLNIPTIISDNFTCDVKDSHIRSLDQDLKNIKMDELIGASQPMANGVSTKDAGMEIDDNTVIEEGSFPTDSSTGAPTKLLLDSAVSESYHSILDFMRDKTNEDNSLVQPEENQFIIRVKYRNLEVGMHQIMSEGCRLFYGPPADTLPQYSSEQINMFGPPNMKQIHFPPCSTLSNPKQERLTSQLLNVLDRGLLLQCHDNNIYATRKCRLVIFVVPANSVNRQPIKLERDSNNPVEIFNFKHFLDCLVKYINGNVMSPPSAEVLIGFGQDWKSENNPSNNLLISASVFHSQALFHLAQFNCLDYPLQVSKSDDWDKLVDRLKDLQMKTNSM